MALALAGGTAALTGRALAGGAVAGAGTALGTVTLYRGLARGRMGLVAPVSAVVAAALPVCYALIRGDDVRASHLAGVVLGVVAVALVSAGGDDSASSTVSTRTSVVDGALAGVGFAVFYIGLDSANATSAWPPAIAFAISTVVLLVGLAAQRPPALRGRTAWALIALGGVTGAGAAWFFERSADRGGIAIASVLTSMYPAVTMILAAVMLRERYRAVNFVGMAGALVAIALIAT
jgi:drug/metabolite transporter (DMT)-like permease